MKLAISHLLIFIVSCYVLACSVPKAVEQEKPFPTGDYRYTSFDKSGAKVVEGRLSITSVEPRRIEKEVQIQIKGNWELKKVGNQERIGAQVGSGDLSGSVTNGEVYINLNPNI